MDLKINVLLTYTDVAVPRRPYEVKLPAELLYEIKFNCTDMDLVGDVRVAFRKYITSRIGAHGTCAASLTGCIVDDVSASCVRRRRRRQSAVDRPRQRRRRRRRRRRRSRSPEEAAARRSRRRRRRRKRHFHERRSAGATTTPPPLLAVRFSVATQLLGGSTGWPDDYHRAVYWLRTVYDDVEDQLNTDDFRLAHLERSLDGLVSEVEDSLTEAPLETVCSDPGFEFNSDILLCGTLSLSSRVMNKKLNCRRGTARRSMSVVILSAAAQLNEK